MAHIPRMNRILWSIAVGIALTVGSAHARLGWTLDETVSAYGQPIYGPYTDFTDKVVYIFESQLYQIGAFFTHGQLSTVGYAIHSSSHTETILSANGLVSEVRTVEAPSFNESMLRTLLSLSAPESTWSADQWPMIKKLSAKGIPTTSPFQQRRIALWLGTVGDDCLYKADEYAGHTLWVSNREDATGLGASQLPSLNNVEYYENFVQNTIEDVQRVEEEIAQADSPQKANNYREMYKDTYRLQREDE